MCEGEANKHDVVELAAEWPHSWFTRNWVLPEFVGPTMTALNGMLFGFIAVSVFQYVRFKFIIQNVELFVRKDEKMWQLTEPDPDPFHWIFRSTPPFELSSRRPLPSILPSLVERRSMNSPNLSPV